MLVVMVSDRVVGASGRILPASVQNIVKADQTKFPYSGG
jgi:hypothetical protein